MPQRLLKFALCLLLTAGAVLRGQAAPAIEHWVSANGARVYFIESRVLPMLDIQVDFAAGSMVDPPAKAGRAALTRSLLDLGAGPLDETAIAEQLADVGAALGGSADTDRASISLRTLSAPDKRGPALAILRQILQSPRFEAAVFEREQARTVAGIKEALTRPDSIAGRTFWAALYPAHPYGRQATPESVAALTRDDLQAHYQQYYVARNAVVTVVGDLSRSEAAALVDQLLDGLPEGAPATLPAPPKGSAGRTQAIAHPASQAHIYIGLPAIERGHPDFFPLLVGNYTLGGGGFVSRLMQEVRDKRGFAYSVYSYFAPLRHAGPFQIGLQTKRSQAREAIQVTRSVLDGFLRQGPTPDELAAAKANLTGAFPLRLDSNRKLLDNAAVIGFYGLPLDYLDTYQDKVRAVTAEDVRRAFARHVRPADLVTVTVAAE